MRSLIKFARLETREKKYFLHSFYLMSYYGLALKLKPLQLLLKETKQRAEKKPAAGKNALSLPRAARLARVAGNLVPLATCLSKTLAGHILLGGQGYRTRIHIGVAKDEEAGFEAHAWLTHNGVIVIGSLPDLQKYKELPF